LQHSGSGVKVPCEGKLKDTWSHDPANDGSSCQSLLRFSMTPRPPLVSESLSSSCRTPDDPRSSPRPTYPPAARNDSPDDVGTISQLYGLDVSAAAATRSLDFAVCPSSLDPC
jgi:hypothetical protein